MKAMGIGDYQRYVLMLYQGGFLSRAGDIKKFTYSKTEIAKSSEEKMANSLMDLREKMFGYNQADPEKRMLKRARKIEGEMGMRELTAEDEPTAEEPAAEEVRVECKPEMNGHPIITPPPPPKKATVQRVQILASTANGSRELFMEMADDYDRIKSVLPHLTVKDFLIMWLRGSGNA